MAIASVVNVSKMKKRFHSNNPINFINGFVVSGLIGFIKAEKTFYSRLIYIELNDQNQ